MNLLSRVKSTRNKRCKKEVCSQGVNLFTCSNGKEQVNNLGSYYLIEKEYSDCCIEFPTVSHNCLEKNLRLIKGIGPVTEQKLRHNGINSIRQLAIDSRWSKEAEKVLESIKQGNVAELKQRGVSDFELLSFFKDRDLVFLDIESTGLWPNQPLFLVGILFKENDKLKLQQFLARNYHEEKPLLHDLYYRLENFKVMVTYNGKKFDVPYIEGRWIEYRFFYKLKHFQIDLLYHARRHFKNEFPDCRLVTLEKKLLQSERVGDIPGYLIPMAYHRFVRGGSSKLLLDIIKHNELDLITLAKVLYIIRPCVDIYQRRKVKTPS